MHIRDTAGQERFRSLTAAYYRHLMRVTGGKLAEVARLAGISRTTAYEWKERYGEEEPPV